MKHRILISLVLVAAWYPLFSCSSLEVEKGARETGQLPYETVMVESGPAVTINGRAVDEKELQILASLQAEEIMAEFVRKYHAVQGEGFWEHSFDGEVPIAHLEKWTVYEAVWSRLSQEMAVEHGLRESSGMEDKWEKLQEENDRRQQLKEKGAPIYGPDQYTIEEFYPIDEQSLELALIQTLESKEILRDEGRGRDRRIHRIERMKMAFRQLIEEKMKSCEVRVNKSALKELILPQLPGGKEN